MEQKQLTPTCFGEYSFRDSEVRGEYDCHNCAHWANCMEYTHGLDSVGVYRPEAPSTDASPLAQQVDGNHYKDLKIQPVEYIHANNIGYMEGNVIKYVSRWRAKNGIRDLEKAKHYIDLLIELESKRGNDA